MLRKFWPIRPLAVLLIYAVVAMLFFWSISRFWMYVGAGVLIWILVVWINATFGERPRPRKKADVEAAFERAYKAVSPMPELVISSSYGYPAFQVSFREKSDVEAAADSNAVFRREMAEMFKDVGLFWDGTFDVDKALWFTYDGYLDDLRAKWKAEQPR